MHFQHAAEIWRDFPGLVPGALFVEGINADVSVGAHADKFTATAASRLAAGVGLSRASGPLLVVVGPVVVAGEDVTGAGLGFGDACRGAAGPARLL
jgi:hypothetical protein